MQATNIQKILQEQFPQLAEKALQEEIIAVAQIHHFKAGDVIMNYGGYIRMVPLLVKGGIKVFREDEEMDKEILLYILNPGETCSMSFTCCMTNKKSAIRTEAIEDTLIIGLPIKQVDSWMTKYQSWKNFVMKTYDTKMLDLVKFIDNIAFKGLDQRLELYLKAIVRATGNATISITHQQVADDLNVTREAVSRLLKKMTNLGKINMERNQITVLVNGKQ